MLGMDEYQNSLNKTTYQKIKGEIKSALFWYILFEIIKFIIRILTKPIIWGAKHLASFLYHQSEKIIPKTTAERNIDLIERKEDCEARRQQQEREVNTKNFKKTFDDSFERWKEQNQITHER